MSYESYALNFAKEITVANIQSKPVPSDEVNAKDVADFFETIYNRVLKLSTKN